MSAAGAESLRPELAAPIDLSVAAVVDALCAAHDGIAPGAGPARAPRPLPSRDAVAAIVDDLRAVLFPRHFGLAAFTEANLRYAVGARLDHVQQELAEQVWRGLAFTCDHPGNRGKCAACADRGKAVARALVARLPAIRAVLLTDLRAAYEGDPAATFLDETLLCYPGVTAVTQYRIAHELHLLRVPLIPRIISELAHAATGIDIHPGAAIGGSFFIDHGTGVVIGETCAIGERVRLYQGVTLGARGFPSDEAGNLVKGEPRHPVVEDGVVIYAGATILGRITIGRGATIGGNVWLTRSVAPGARVTQAQVRHDTFQDGSGI
ncbi:MAG: serine O-acetyltransferase EpsC [Pseudomonadota bacterium]